MKHMEVGVMHIVRVKVAAVVLIACGLAACTSVSDVTKTGRDSYMVGVTVRGGLGGDAGAQASAIKAANEFCVRQGKVVQVAGAQGSGIQGLTPVSSVVHFSCIDG